MTSPLRTALLKSFFDKHASSIPYVVADLATRRCAIIDPVLDFDGKSGATAKPWLNENIGVQTAAFASALANEKRPVR